jgi:polyphosphate kinase 2 (PPK2 family)
LCVALAGVPQDLPLAAVAALSLFRLANHRRSFHPSAGQGQGASMSKNHDGEKLGRKSYERELRKLQVELCHLQAWVKAKGERIIIVLEGRDAAGKGGTIKAITARVSPRVFRVVALPAPSDREKGQMYMQR